VLFELVQTQQDATLLLDNLVKTYPEADEDYQEQHCSHGVNSRSSHLTRSLLGQKERLCLVLSLGSLNLRVQGDAGRENDPHIGLSTI
jgi:hypothetical protein